jgi:hypothetical protein
LTILKEYTNVGEYLKYNIEYFLMEYEVFANHDPAEQMKLMGFANWMNVLLNVLPATVKKGIRLAAVTKCVEGYQANCITGKGQKPSVDDRVYIYETEGKVQKLKRTRVAKVKDIVKVRNQVVQPSPTTVRPRRHGQSITQLFTISGSFADGWNKALQHDSYTDTEDADEQDTISGYHSDGRDTTSSYLGDGQEDLDFYDQDMQDMLDLVVDIGDLDEKEFLAMLERLPDLPVNADGLKELDVEDILAMVQDMPDFIGKSSDAWNME